VDIKDKKSSLELKINSEQNRVLMGNIRPSSYNKKNEAPIMAEYDEMVKSTSSFMDKKSNTTFKKLN
jgi:hypothetical protein